VYVDVSQLKERTGRMSDSEVSYSSSSSSDSELESESDNEVKSSVMSTVKGNIVSSLDSGEIVFYCDTNMLAGTNYKSLCDIVICICTYSHNNFNDYCTILGILAGATKNCCYYLIIILILINM